LKTVGRKDVQQESVISEPAEESALKPKPMHVAERKRTCPDQSTGMTPPDAWVPFRIDPELRAAIDDRGAVDGSSTSEVIREALRRFLEVA
jgi:hypothetical protein